jgi:hypothetical protein
MNVRDSRALLLEHLREGRPKQSANPQGPLASSPALQEPLAKHLAEEVKDERVPVHSAR